MTTTLTPTTIGDQIVALPPDLANSIAQARTRFDAMKKKAEEEEDPEEDADESDEEEDEEDSKMSFFDKMKAAKAAKSSKKDSDDIEAILDRIDSLEAENEVLASLVNQEINEDAEDHEDADDEDMADMTPQEIAIQLVAEFEKARPFLPPNASVADYSDIYDIYEDAIETRAPGIILSEEMSEDDGDRVDPTDADELRGAFKMLRRMANPMQMQPSISMDSADRSFAEALGLRSDGCGEGTMIKTTKRTEYY